MIALQHYFSANLTCLKRLYCKLKTSLLSTERNRENNLKFRRKGDHKNSIPKFLQVYPTQGFAPQNFHWPILRFQPSEWYVHTYTIYAVCSMQCHSDRNKTEVRCKTEDSLGVTLPDWQGSHVLVTSRFAYGSYSVWSILCVAAIDCWHLFEWWKILLRVGKVHQRMLDKEFEEW